MNELLSLTEIAAGFIMLTNLLLFDAIPTPPMLLLYAVPSFEMSPIPKMEYGEYAPYDPFVWPDNGAQKHIMAAIATNK